MQCTGLDREEAIVFLHDHDNNVAEAVNAFFEGEQASSGWSERTKKKKPKAKVFLLSLIIISLNILIINV